MTSDHQNVGGAHAPSPTSWSISLSDVSVTYRNETTALRNVSLEVGAGEMLSIVGLSGSGKSTLIRTINGLVPVVTGTVRVGPHTVNDLKGRQLRNLRGNIGMIFQGFNLAERTSVYRNVMVGRFAHTRTSRTLLGISSERDRQLVMTELNSVGLLDKVWTRAHDLSGGQKQRVAIARALAQEPSVMLADEPVASLDPPTAHSVMSDLRRINEERGLTVLVNLHLLDLAQQYTHRMIGLRAGEVVFDGLAAEATESDFEQIYGRSIGTKDRLGSGSP